MRHATVKSFVKSRPTLPSGIIGILLCESAVHADHSAQALVSRGIGGLIAIGDHGGIGDLDVPVFRIDQSPVRENGRQVLNKLFPVLSGRWVVWLWNGEFLIFPFCETRALADLTQFLTDERRQSLYTYTLDLYAPSMPAPADPPDQTALYFDRIGYHAFPKEDRQLRLYGALGWRFEECCPPSLQQLGRTAFLKVGAGTRLDREGLFNDSNLNGVSCPWHRNPTGAVMSLRRAQRIFAHPGFHVVADQLMWNGTTPCEWNSQQLLELGMIEPGQWF